MNIVIQFHQNLAIKVKLACVFASQIGTLPLVLELTSSVQNLPLLVVNQHRSHNQGILGILR